MDDSENSISSILLSGFTNLAEKIGEVIVTAVRWFESNNNTVSEYASTFIDFGQFLVAVNKLKNSQIVFTDDIDLKLAQRICKTDCVEKEIENYFFYPADDRTNQLITRCEQELDNEHDRKLFKQIVFAFRNEHYLLACIGLFALIDGVLSDISNDDSTNFRKRVDAIRSKVTRKTKLTELDKKTIVICLSINEVRESLFKNEPFSQDEPIKLNRNWLIHGRAEGEITRFDFIKELLFLDAICHVGNLKITNNSEETGEENAVL